MQIRLLVCVLLPFCLCAQPMAVLNEWKNDVSLSGASYGFCVRDVSSGKILAEHNAASLLIPASTLKLLTTSAALDLLGNNFHFQTHLLYTGTFNKQTGVLQGDLIIRGSGDPSLESENFAGVKISVTDLWAKALKDKGLREIKGRIIGREGRNIRALEAMTGVEIIVDDTPEAIILSCFDPVRREIARLSLHQLVTDGRIHPARIEEVVAKVTKNINEEIVEIGKRTTIELGIHGLHSELVRMVGRMKYRSSYGQNLLQHSREVANLCATMASELGLNAKAAKRAGLLHDIGKVPDDESELPHAILGMKIAEKYGEKPDICNAIGAHHDEIEMKTLLSPIIQVCDAISGARPGARREVVEAYIQRLRDLENLALENVGVSKAFAIQAGRELRVMVEADRVSDAESDALAVSLAAKIETEMTYPGQVRVTVIREKRAVGIAR